MKELEKFRRENGSITVEACIVVPVILLTILAMVYTGLILYQQSILQSLAEKTASRGAACWNLKDADIATGKVYMADFDEAGLYWRLWDDTAPAKISHITEYGKAAGDKQTLITPVERRLEVRIQDLILYKKLEVILEDRYSIPGGRFLRIFGLGENYILRVKASARLEDSAELIRNTDFLIDLERELESKYPGLGNLGEKTRGVVKGMREKLADLVK